MRYLILTLAILTGLAVAADARPRQCSTICTGTGTGSYCTTVCG